MSHSEFQPYTPETPVHAAPDALGATALLGSIDVDEEFMRMMAAEGFGTDTVSAADTTNLDAAPEGFGSVGELSEEEIDAHVAVFAKELGTDAEDGNGEMQFTDSDREFLEANGIAARAMTQQELVQVQQNELKARQAAEVMDHVMITRQIAELDALANKTDDEEDDDRNDGKVITTRVLAKKSK